jgi:hypothetical protein
VVVLSVTSRQGLVPVTEQAGSPEKSCPVASLKRLEMHKFSQTPYQRGDLRHGEGMDLRARKYLDRAADQSGDARGLGKRSTNAVSG